MEIGPTKIFGIAETEQLLQLPNSPEPDGTLSSEFSVATPVILHISMLSTWLGFSVLSRLELEVYRPSIVQSQTAFPVEPSFASVRLRKSSCDRCGKLTIEPALPYLEREEQETRLDFEFRKLEETNILFLFLGGFLRFLTTESLKAIWIHLGMGANGMSRAFVPRIISPKQAYVISITYQLARLLPPETSY